MDLILKGIIIGIGKIAPGISGSVLAITLGIYEKIIDAISNLKKDIINNSKYLFKIGIGIIISIIIFSKIIVKCMDKYYLPTMLLFAGMITGGNPKMIKNIRTNKQNIKNMIYMIITIIILTLIIYITVPQSKMINNNILKYTLAENLKLIGIGIIDALASIIPGISGTAILMTLGYYNIIIETFASITEITKLKQTIFVLPPFILGFIIGIIFLSKIINITFKKNKTELNMLLFLFVTITNIMLIKNTFTTSYTVTELTTGIILFIVGLTATLYIDKHTKDE